MSSNDLIKRRSRILALSIFGSALLVCATAIWVTLRVTSVPETSPARLDQPSAPANTRDGPLENAGARATEPPDSAPAKARAVKPGAKGDSVMQRLSQDEFSRVWRGPLRKTAEKQCFAPHDQLGAETEPSPFFDVWVAKDGRVVKVSFDPYLKRYGELFPCVAKIVEQVRLPPGSARRGLVQAERVL